MADETMPAESRGEFDRLVGVLFDPKPAFADVAARPQSWWVPLLLLTVLIVGFTLAFGQRVGWESFMRQQLEQSARTRNLTAEQKEQAIAMQMRFVPYAAPVQSALAFPFIALVVTGAFLFVFNILVGAELRFKPAWGLTCYALLPQVFGILLAFVVLYVKDPAEFDLNNPVASNLGAFLDPNTLPAWVVSLGNSLDVFVVWSLLLLATGFAAAARRLSWWRSFGWVVATWALWLVVKCGWVWIRS